MPQQGDILIIDDTIQNLRLLMTVLTEAGYNVRPANGPSIGLRSAAAKAPDLILLDIDMPEMDGYEVCRRLKADPDLRDIPVLFISAYSETFDKVQAFAVGGLDYITKPFEAEEVLARVRTHVRLRQRERELQALLAQQHEYFSELAAMQKDLMSTAAHDLKNPLSLILGSAHLLEDSNDPEVTEAADSIQTAAKFMLELISDMLDMAQVESGLEMRRDPVIMEDYLHHLFIRQVPPNREHETHIDLPPTQTPMIIDTLHMERALGNLLSNARKYTPSGGSVRLTMTREADNILIRIADTGLGIPARDLPHVFEKFYRVNRPRSGISGTGLGLSIVKAVIEQHGGSIQIESQPDRGTTVFVRLPLAPVAAGTR